MAVSGNSVVLQIGKETTHGTAATTTKQFKISSESLKPNYAKQSEGLATGGRGEGLMATMGIGVDGSVSTLMRADMGYIIAGALGVEAAVTGSESTGHTHKFTCLASAPNTYLPSFTIKVDRKVGQFAYTGCKINSLNLTASQGDYLKADIAFVGRDETSGTTLAALTPSALKAFKFSQAKLYNGASEIADIKSIGISINNNLDSQTQTTSTGDHYAEASVGTRAIQVTAEQIYTTAAETLRASYYKSDATLGIKAEFISDENITGNVKYKMTVNIPCCQLSDASANMSDPNSSLAQSMTFNAVDNLSDELIEITLLNNDSTKYI